jgi:hypothetical protein
MKMNGKARRSLALRVLLLACVGSSVACSWMQSHSRGGTAWNAACASHPSTGCACRVDKDCETNWCVNGECDYRMP